MKKTYRKELYHMNDIKNVFNLKAVMCGSFQRYKVYQKPCIVPSNGGHTGIKGQAKNPDKSLQQAIARAKDKIHGYIMANNWDYWSTQTFNAKVIDRYNLDEIIKRYNQKLRDLKRRKYNELQWLIVPEQHKDGAWHLHMFMSGIPQERIKYSGYDYYNKNNGISRRVYNWLDTIDYGFNDYICIKDIEPLERFKMANYITKYITKDLAQKRFNKKMYWCNKGLNEPIKTNTLTDNIDAIDAFIAPNIILSHNTYYVKNNETGEIFNKVYDFTVYNDTPF